MVILKVSCQICFLASLWLLIKENNSVISHSVISSVLPYNCPSIRMEGSQSLDTFLTTVGSDKIVDKTRNESSCELFHAVDYELDMSVTHSLGQIRSVTKDKK